MAESPRTRLMIVRPVRVPEDAPGGATPAPSQELSDYELLECRSRELEERRMRGELGTSQPPDAATPLLFPKAGASGAKAPNGENDTPTGRPHGTVAPGGLGRM
jgi:hypothetical protein